jgi:2-keto-4-pentenoate hydratase/2-oxohepta-3-ene-1,7-dioic acid hydratase in catechol pathway
MKVGRYVGASGDERLGVVLEDAGALSVLDLLGAFAAHRGTSGFPTGMDALIDAGGKGLDLAYATLDWARRQGQADWFADERAVDWMVPVAVRNCIATGRNFAQHVAEAREYWARQGVAEPHRDFPTGFTKLTSVLVPHRAEVRKPESTRMFDYEVEVAAIIGTSVEDVPVSKARAAIWGYSVLNDLSARDWQRREMANQLLLLGKNFPGFGPFGPWILTADEVPDPSKLVVSLSVNGEERQRSACDVLIHDFDHMVAHWSQLGLQRGDVITSGTPQGVAIGMKPDPEPYFLKPGDVVRAAVEQVGVLETRIV